MIRIKNIKEVEEKLNGVVFMTGEIENSSGQDIVKKVKNSIKPEGTPISPESGVGQPRDALFEATYRGEMAGEKNNAKKAKSEMNKKELEKNDDEIVDRFIRDFFQEIMRGI